MLEKIFRIVQLLRFMGHKDQSSFAPNQTTPFYVLRIWNNQRLWTFWVYPKWLHVDRCMSHCIWSKRVLITVLRTAMSNYIRIVNFSLHQRVPQNGKRVGRDTFPHVEEVAKCDSQETQPPSGTHASTSFIRKKSDAHDAMLVSGKVDKGFSKMVKQKNIIFKAILQI